MIEEKGNSVLDDGKGNTHSRVCPSCNKQSMYVFNTNDFRCRHCYTEKWVVLDLESIFNSNDINLRKNNSSEDKTFAKFK